ncbi:MAG: ABC transporter permease [Romboutsia sp.]
MRLLANIKMLLKYLKNNFLLLFATFLVIPLTLSLFLANVLNIVFENPINVDPIPITIVDKDNSIASTNFKNFINNDIKDLFYVNNDDSELKLIIPKNYEESIKNKKSIIINIEQLQSRGSSDSMLKDIIDDYHEKLYLNNLNLDTNTSKIFSESSINTTLIDSNKVQSSSEYYAISMLIFLLMIFMSNNLSAEYMLESTGMRKRMQSMPIKRTTQLIYDFVLGVIYSLIFTSLYIIINRTFNIAFNENLVSLFIVSLVSCVLVSCISVFISSFFSNILGTTVISVIMIVYFLFGGIFFPLSDKLSIFSKLSPFYLINEMFMNFTLSDTLSSISSTIFITLLFSLLLFIVSFIKEKYSWREF